MEKYLVITGNEFGYDLLDLDFVDIETAEQRFAEYMEEYECAVMYKVSEHGLEVVKSESDF